MPNPRYGGLLLGIALGLCAHAGAFADAPRLLRLTFVGDLMAHPRLFAAADYRDIYRGISGVLAESDLTFANLEFLVDSTRPTSGYPRFNAHPDYVRAALESGINVFSTANNHVFDGGPEGVLQTVRALASLAGESPPRLFSSGTRGNPSRPFLPATIVVKGVRVGFVGVTQFLNEPGGQRWVHVVDYNDARAQEEFIGFVREASRFYDLFIVSCHGDREYAAEPDPATRAFFRRLAENGADIVFGHHSHVLQPYEMVRIGGRMKLVMHSMGNFVSGMAFREAPPDPDAAEASLGDSIMLRVDVTVGSAGASVARVTPVPIADFWNARGEPVVLRLDDLADGTAAATPAWRAYFRARRERVGAFLAGLSGFARSASAR